MLTPGDARAGGTLPGIGQQVGPYRLERELGRGGMGVVFEAVHTVIGQRVALKLLRPERPASTAVVRQLLDEARALSAVRHEGLVRIFGFGPAELDGDDGGGPQYLVMELLAGETLLRRLQRSGPLSIDDALRIGWQLALPLCALHRAGLVHRDLKPANVMLVPDDAIPGGERAKILDFGISRLASASEPAPAPAVSGTPRYMAPEQAAGLPLTGRADVYSLGVLLHEALAGRPPATADRGDGPAPSLRALVPAVPPALEALLLRLLAAAPAMRPDMESVAAQLAALRAPAPPPPPGDPTADTADVLSPFQVHRPLDRAAQFHGREALLRTLFGWWQSAPLDSVALLGPRMSGKTSLLRQLTHLAARRGLRPDQAAPWLPAAGTLRLVLVDFEDPRLQREAGLLRFLARHLELPERSATDLDHFIEDASTCVTTPTVILLDHLDTGLRGDVDLPDALWDGLRALTCNYTDGKLAFALAARELPRELARSHQRSSSFFALFRTVSLGPLDEGAARSLLRGSPLPFPADDADWILRESGCWPRLLQIGCDHLLRALRAGQRDRAWREDAAREMASARDPR